MSLPRVERLLEALDADFTLGIQDWWMDECGSGEYDEGVFMDRHYAVLENATDDVEDLRKYFDVRTLGELVLVPWGARH